MAQRCSQIGIFRIIVNQVQFWKISFSVNSMFWSAFVCVHATPMKMKLCKLISSFNQCMWFYWPELKKIDSRDLSILNLENCIKCQKWHHLIRISQSNQTRNFRRYCHPLKKFTFGQFFRQPKSLSVNFWDRHRAIFVPENEVCNCPIRFQNSPIRVEATSNDLKRLQTPFNYFNISDYLTRYPLANFWALEKSIE